MLTTHFGRFGRGDRSNEQKYRAPASNDKARKGIASQTQEERDAERMADRQREIDEAESMEELEYNDLKKIKPGIMRQGGKKSVRHGLLMHVLLHISPSNLLSVSNCHFLRTHRVANPNFKKGGQMEKSESTSRIKVRRAPSSLSDSTSNMAKARRTPSSLEDSTSKSLQEVLSRSHSCIGATSSSIRPNTNKLRRTPSSPCFGESTSNKAKNRRTVINGKVKPRA